MAIKDDQLLTPGEVARQFGVDPHTVWLWGKQGKLQRITTPGGRGRYRQADVDILMYGGGPITIELALELPPGRRLTPPDIAVRIPRGYNGPMPARDLARLVGKYGFTVIRDDLEAPRRR